MIPYGLHEGNRSEFLGWFALSTIGFAVPVPRQSDQFGVDFLVHLARRAQGKNNEGNKTDNMVATGKVFQLQIKSDNKPVVAEGEEAMDCLLHSTSPFFVGVVSKKESSICIYPTTNRLCFAGVNETKRLQLVPGKTNDRMAIPKDDTDEVHLGKPIAEFDLDDLDASSGKKEQRQLFFDVMYSWTVFEEWMLAWITDGMPFAAVPYAYETNRPLEYDQLEVVHTDQPVHLPKLLKSINKNMQLVSLYFNTRLKSEEAGESKQVRELLGADLQEIIAHCKQIQIKTGEIMGPHQEVKNLPTADQNSDNASEH